VTGYENGALVEPVANKTYKLNGATVTVTLPRRDFQIFF